MQRMRVMKMVKGGTKGGWMIGGAGSKQGLQSNHGNEHRKV